MDKVELSSGELVDELSRYVYALYSSHHQFLGVIPASVSPETLLRVIETDGFYYKELEIVDD